MSKQILMLSAATAALLAGPAFADTTISSSTSTALTTGAAWKTTTITGVGTPNAGNITISTAGSVAIGTASVGAITVDSSNYVYSVGAISNNDVSSASGILIDVSTNPNLSSASFTNAVSATISGAGVYVDSVSNLSLTGAGTGKHGIWLNATNGDGTYTGDIIFNSNSTVTINGDSSYGVLISTSANTGATGAILNGDLNFGGEFKMTQTTALSTTASGLYGLLMQGEVNGNILLPAGGAMTISGDGATGMSIQGSGVTGSISIGGSLSTVGYTATATTVNTILSASALYPEAGTALEVGANVGNGIAILGPGFLGDTSVAAASVSASGTAPAIVINPGVNVLYSSAAPQTAPLVVGVYSRDGTIAGRDTNDPGFSFYNRGSITAQPTNVNNSAIAMGIIGSSASLPTILTGGVFNSGSISASATTTGTTASANSATAMNIGSYALLEQNLGAKNPIISAIDPGDQAAFVNSNASGSGKITAAVSGTRGGTAAAIGIAANASVPSLINSGTIAASATTTDVTITNPLHAVAIQDLSGSLTSIYNRGTISAQATTLNSNAQVTTAIDLSSGNPATPSGAGVTITDQSTSTNSATITGNIYFGTGNYQVLIINGNSPTHLASVTGNVSYGAGTVAGGNQLTIGAYGQLLGTVASVQGSGVAVDVKQYGTLALENTTTPLYATTFDIESYGGVSLGVSESLTNSGVVAADTSATVAPNARLGVAFDSFIPQAHDFVLITAPQGHLNIDPATVTLYNAALQTTVSGGGSLPYLFASANLQCIGTSPGCTAPAPGSVTDEFVLHVVPKEIGTGANQLPLTAGSYANTPLATTGGGTSTLFELANAALVNDDTLGSFMINSIHNAAQAQAAYNSFAPNVTGGTRAIVISITDQATGVVGARQRMLNLYGKEEGGTTLWGQEFVQMIKDPGQGAVDPNTTYKVRSGFKDRGFGFALGIDGGSPKYGWYGGAFTFYSGDVGELARYSRTNEQWYILSGYSTWRGKGLFFDSKIDAGYGHFDSKRFISLVIGSGSGASAYTREADSRHPGTMISGGFTTGGIFSYGATTLSPQISVDGLLMREEGYTEFNPATATVGDAFNLKVQPYYAKSLRVFLGGSVRYDLDLWDFYLQPEAHVGYRYDFLNDPVKLKAAFAYADTTGGIAGPGTQFTMRGPDPAQGNYVVGGSLATTTDAWTLGFNFDFVKGSNGALDEVGTINLLGRI
ncbi:MAG: autotransporter outer membrane beta-barrel domain-containing protein [Rhizomicrobium sp.]